MEKLNLGIYKRHILDNKGHFRWYGANFNPKIHLTGNKHNRPRPPVINLFNYPEIKTEKQFLRFLYTNWGYGAFLVYAYRGRARLQVFWRGEITPEGFRFFKKTFRKKEVDEWKKDLVKMKQEGDKELTTFMKEGLEEAKAEAIEKNKRKKYGFSPFLIASSRRGYFTLWTDEVYNKESLPTWGLNKSKGKSNFNEWGKINSKVFEKW